VRKIADTRALLHGKCSSHCPIHGSSSLRENHRLLWVDLTASVHDTEAANAFGHMFEVQRFATRNSIDAEIARVKPDVVCFDFDFPTKQGLKALQKIKRTHSSLPLLMLTIQHSEALAVWAFRSRVWDYMVKPLAKSEVDRCLCCLVEMLHVKDVLAPRKAAIPASLIPQESRASHARSDAPLTLTPAISYVEKHFQEKISSAQIASLCNLTTFQFSRLFREAYGLTFQEYLMRFRINEACRLLQNPSAQVTDIAFLVGFNDPSYFGKIFKRYTGLTPSRYSSSTAAVLDPEHVLDVLNARQ
jgi:YesN/AraC family two-component response regulator